jgi:hypothetical protein
MIYLVQFADYLEQRVIGGFATLPEAEDFVDRQKTREGYGWFEIISLEVGKPYATKLMGKLHIAGGKEINPSDMEPDFEPEPWPEDFEPEYEDEP